MHSMSFFSFYSVLATSVWIAVGGIPIVIPSSLSFVVFLFLIGVFGFLAQVRSVLCFNFRCDLTDSSDTLDAWPSTGNSFARKHGDLHTGQFAA